MIRYDENIRLSIREWSRSTVIVSRCSATRNTSAFGDCCLPSAGLTVRHDGIVVEISFLTEPDRARWEVLARCKDIFFEVERSDDDYERTWRRLLDEEQIRGIAARFDGKMVGIAHYLFHASVWYAGKCYLAGWKTPQLAPSTTRWANFTRDSSTMPTGMT